MEILKNRLNVAVAALACVFSCPVAFAKTPAHYQQHNLVSSDASISADHIDPNLVNPWGLVFGPTNPVWIANNGTGTSTLYDGMGNAIPLIVNIPSSGGGTGTPTGIVFNNTSGWVISSGGKSASAIFIFATEDGTISAWTPSVNPNNAIIAVNDPSKGAIYKGLAIGSDGTRSLLYASNFNSGNVDVFDSNFAPTTVPGGFVDTHLPKGYAPFGIHNIQGNIYVANPQSRGGLIGNNFPKAINGRIQIDQINEVVYCKKCFFEILETNHDDLKPIISQQQRELS